MVVSVTRLVTLVCTKGSIAYVIAVEIRKETNEKKKNEENETAATRLHDVLLALPRTWGSLSLALRDGTNVISEYRWSNFECRYPISSP